MVNINTNFDNYKEFTLCDVNLFSIDKHNSYKSILINGNNCNFILDSNLCNPTNIDFNKKYVIIGSRVDIWFNNISDITLAIRLWPSSNDISLYYSNIVNNYISNNSSSSSSSDKDKDKISKHDILLSNDSMCSVLVNPGNSIHFSSYINSCKVYSCTEYELYNNYSCDVNSSTSNKHNWFWNLLVYVGHNDYDKIVSKLVNDNKIYSSVTHKITYYIKYFD